MITMRPEEEQEEERNGGFDFKFGLLAFRSVGGLKELSWVVKS